MIIVGISTNTSNLVLALGFHPRVVASSIAIVSLGMIFHLPTTTVSCSGADLKVYMYSDLKIVTRNFKSDLKVYTFMSPEVVVLARKKWYQVSSIKHQASIISLRRLRPLLIKSTFAIVDSKPCGRILMISSLCYLILVLPSYTCSAELLEEKKKLAPFVQVLLIFDGTKDMVVQLTAAIDGTKDMAK
ncbi:hypothetical protein L6452_03192 [Arctium lappa]|uniref:Uncharacterized protein n=1 Tax=Arctium lappa TaxID=4217 RepID=A0ACB9FM54_ARCLA|nr:hypothetical protein L6452_03192 [Arctium lappa]